MPSTSNEETNLNVADIQSPARAILKANDQNKGPKVVVQSVNSAESPLSKFLKLPEPKQNKKQKAKKEILPKAVTGIEFRKILEEKKKKRENAEAEKIRRQKEHEIKRLEKEKEKKEKERKRMGKKGTTRITKETEAGTKRSVIKGK